MAVGAVFAMLSPIMDFIYAMLFLLSVNFAFGLIAARFEGERWSWKKAGMFFVMAAIFFAIVVSIFILGRFLHCEDRAVGAVQYVCWATTYFFGTNILKNWRSILTEGSTWHKLVDFLYYILSAEFIEDLPYFKRYQEHKRRHGHGKESESEGEQGTAAHGHAECEEQG